MNGAQLASGVPPTPTVADMTAKRRRDGPLPTCCTAAQRQSGPGSVVASTGHGLPMRSVLEVEHLTCKIAISDGDDDQ